MMGSGFNYIRLALYGGIALIIALCGLAMTAYTTLYRSIALSAPQTVDIRPSASFGYVAARLEARKIIPSAFTLKTYARLTGQATKLKVGEYEVVSGQRPVDIVEMLVTGRAKAYWITIPEGKWASEIDELIGVHWPGAVAEFQRLVNDPHQWAGRVLFPLQDDTLEGYLFPDTYRFVTGVKARDIVQVMLKRQQETNWAAYRAHPPADGRSFHEVLVLASLVEAEAKKAGERPIIAGVYMNRLKKGMLLQCDATVLYARRARLNRVLYSDLAIESPYNTYRNPGLPPGPINNPGLSAFMAALQPAQTPYLYYVAQGDGSHVFSRTLAEHQAAIVRIRGN